jgi:hypothetical protein
MRPLVAAGLLLGGVATGIATVALHELWWGLPLAVAAVGLTLFALPAGWWSRLPFAVGLVGVVGWLTIPRREGDYVIGSDVPGYALLSLCLVVIVTAVTTLPRPNRADPDLEDPLS